MVAERRGAEIAGYVKDTCRATEYIAAIQPDVMILDIQLPAGSGIGVLREVERMQSAPVVMMLTNYSAPEYRLAAGRPEQSCFSTNPPRLTSWWTFSEE